MRTKFLLIAICLSAGCVSTPRDNSRQMEQIIVGQWEWEVGPEHCASLVNMAFKRNGTYTRTTESCSFADDGFGIFHYGWYVANEHLCFVSISEQFENGNPGDSVYKTLFAKRKQEGYSIENCHWKMQRATRSRVTITVKHDEGSATTFTMIRRRWL